MSPSRKAPELSAPPPTAAPRLTIEYVDPKTLNPAPYNPRTMSDKSRARRRARRLLRVVRMGCRTRARH